MANRPEKDTDKLRDDANETAYRVLQEALGERPKTRPPEERTEADKPTSDNAEPENTKLDS